MKKTNINKLLDKPVTLHEKFHSKTKLIRFKEILDGKNWPEEWKKIYYKGYARFPEIKLPSPFLPQNISLKDALITRESKRSFSNNKISIKKLSNLLYFSAGINKESSKQFPHRFYPSAGARYPIETYIIPLNSEIPMGVYHYYLKNHSLENMGKINIQKISKIFNQNWITKAGCIIVLTAVFNRNTTKYGDRGYRMVLTETGLLAQNFNLVSSAINISSCMVDGYLDNEISNILGIDGVQESVITVIAVGKNT